MNNPKLIERGSREKDFINYDLLILGLSTWYDGDLQSDWEIFFPNLDNIDFSGKNIAIFGLGDQMTYSEYFVDGLGILAKEILKSNGEIIGFWPQDGYDFDESKAVFNDTLFYGLVLDECNQYELTKERVNKWLLHLSLDIIDTRDGIKHQ